MRQRAVEEPYTRKQHDETLLEMRSSMRAERRLIELSHACIVRSRELLARTERIVRKPAATPG
ncbi:MAG: hypothetical protein JO339_17405 [Alphaproteobacteria bacterium]|nr:hypothetical protein [Alphaproteobacteria bacterium]